MEDWNYCLISNCLDFVIVYITERVCLPWSVPVMLPCWYLFRFLSLSNLCFAERVLQSLSSSHSAHQCCNLFISVSSKTEKLLFWKKCAGVKLYTPWRQMRDEQDRLFFFPGAFALWSFSHYTSFWVTSLAETKSPELTLCRSGQTSILASLFKIRSIDLLIKEQTVFTH